jgi:hypothetical protein
MGHDTIVFAEAVFLGESGCLTWGQPIPQRDFSGQRSISHVTVPSLYVEKFSDFALTAKKI